MIYFEDTQYTLDSTALPYNFVNGDTSAEPTCSRNANQLLLSNHPETVQSLGRLYEDTFDSPTVRLFAWHVNGITTGTPFYVVVMFTNTQSYPITITLQKLAKVAPTGTYGTGTGATLFMDWYNNNQSTVLGTVQPNTKVVYYQLSTGQLNQDDLAGFMMDLQCTNAHDGSIATITIGTYASQHSDEVTNTSNGNGTKGQRGWFPYNQISFTWNHSVSGKAEAKDGIQLASGYPKGTGGCPPLPQEYAPGRDVISGTAPYNQGQYGVLYAMTINLTQADANNNQLACFCNNYEGGVAMYPAGTKRMIDSYRGTGFLPEYGGLTQWVMWCYDTPTASYLHTITQTIHTSTSAGMACPWGLWFKTQ